MITENMPGTLLFPVYPLLGQIAQRGVSLPVRPERVQLSVCHSANPEPTRLGFLRSLRQVERFTELFSQVRLRQYQQEAARAIAGSVLEQKGLSFVVMFPRQSGKNLLQAQLETYLMVLLAERGAEMVKLSPTYQPQSLNAMRRLESALEGNLLTRGRWRKTAGNHYRFRNAHLTFLSAAPGSNIVGATASTLLQLDEAQDIEIGKYDKQIAPMAASTNATRVFWGTAWTGNTLLARELRAAEQAEAQDCLRRVFRIGAERVRREVPAYGRFVDEQIARLGRSHPMVKSQFFSEEIDFASGLFPPARIGLMAGSHAARSAPQPGRIYALLIDLAGEDESARLDASAAENQNFANPGRDSTALTIVEVDLSLMSDGLIGRPRYRVVQRCLWTGERHSSQYARILSLVEHWQPWKVVVDASGVGAGLASFLRDKLGERLLPVVFNQQVKSKLGWGFLAVVDTGRFQNFDEQQADEPQRQLQQLFLEQARGCDYETSIGPERLLRWSVPQSARGSSGQLLHDDLLLSASLCAFLDDQPWAIPAPGLLIPALDPIEEMNGGY